MKYAIFTLAEDQRIKTRFNVKSPVPYEGELLAIGTMEDGTGILISSLGFDAKEDGSILTVPLYVKFSYAQLKQLTDRVREIGTDLDMTPAGYECIDEHYTVFSSFEDFSPDPN